MQITCPFCFEVFDDKDVHFRRVTFTDDELGESERHRRFWADYQGNSKNTTPPEYIPTNWAKDYDPWEVPIETNSEKLSLQFDPSGFCEAAIEPGTNKVLRQRVCPYCHNPLPQNYGKYETKFVSVIGVTGAGKTVYISQMLYRLRGDFGNLGYTLTPDAVTLSAYLNQNSVKMGMPLPAGTGKETFVPSMTFEMSYFDQARNRRTSKTFVVYDIAGELFDAERDELGHLDNYFKFISHSDAVIMLIDPKQVGLTDDNTVDIHDVTSALTILQRYLKNKLMSNGLISIPIAVCLSKGDKAYEAVHHGVPFMDYQISNMPGCFNARDYNENIQHYLQEYFENGNLLSTDLRNNCGNYNYFMVSAIGHNDIVDQGGGIKILKQNPIPKRIMEPLMWILVQIGYLKADGPINSPCKIEAPVRQSFWKRLFCK